jgi:hypothetical protein
MPATNRSAGEGAGAGGRGARMVVFDLSSASVRRSWGGAHGAAPVAAAAAAREGRV